MGELIAMFLTGGGSTAMGAILKGVFGMVFESRKQKHDLEMARESRGNENFLRLQEQIANSGQAETASKTRKLLATIGVSSMCASIIMCTIFPVQNLSSSQTQQEKVEQKSSSDSLVGNPPKNQFRSLLDTYPLWEISRSSPVFWDFILDHPPADDD